MDIQLEVFLYAQPGERTFPRATEKNGEGGEKTKDQRKLGPASYCARIRSSCERKSMKPRMGTEIDFKKTGSRGFHARVARVIL